MKVIDYFKSGREEYWLDRIGKCDWSAGKYLYKLLRDKTFFDAVGKDSTALLLTDKDELISFCTFAERDDIQPTELTPWMGFVYTFPERRGHRFAGLMFEEIGRLAAEKQIREVYISTEHTGLYEKYGCEYLFQTIDMNGEPSKVYVKRF